MASPQTDQGYIKIANELLKALAKANLRGSEFMICLAVISKTYGWNKKSDQISLTQFELLTGMDRKSCVRALSRLVAQNILGSVKGDTRSATTYWIQKDYDKWDVLSSGNSATSTPSGRSATTPSGKTPPLASGTPIINTTNTTKDILKTAKPLRTKAVFIKPTVDQIERYCQERQNTIDPQYFFDKMEIGGWVYGKHKIPVKDWKAVIRTWESYNKINPRNPVEHEISMLKFGEE